MGALGWRNSQIVDPFAFWKNLRQGDLETIGFEVDEIGVE